MEGLVFSSWGDFIFMEGALALMGGWGCSKKPIRWGGGGAGRGRGSRAPPCPPTWEILVVLKLLFDFSYHKTHAKTLPKVFTLCNGVKQFLAVFKFMVKFRLLSANFRPVQLMPLLTMELKNPLWHSRNHCDNSGLSQENKLSFKFSKKGCY